MELSAKERRDFIDGCCDQSVSLVDAGRSSRAVELFLQQMERIDKSPLPMAYRLEGLAMVSKGPDEVRRWLLRSKSSALSP